MKKDGVPIESGEFGAMMDVALVNNGPVTFVLNSKD
jgi:D-tyrosyl-tRNA(Tyr) deacylase